MYFEVTAFVLVFFYLSNYFQINAFLRQLGQKKIKREIEDKYLSGLFKKVGLNVKKFIIFESAKPFAMMPVMFRKPQVIISSKLYETFNKKEMEYVMMHEAAHYIFRHNIKDALFQAGFLIAGFVILAKLEFNLVVSLLLGILFSILFVRLARFLERETDLFALKNSSSERMISATNKFKKAYPNSSKVYYLFWFLFGWNIMYEERIKIAS